MQKSSESKETISSALVAAFRRRSSASKKEIPVVTSDAAGGQNSTQPSTQADGSDTLKKKKKKKKKRFPMLGAKQRGQDVVELEHLPEQQQESDDKITELRETENNVEQGHTSKESKIDNTEPKTKFEDTDEDVHEGNTEKKSKMEKKMSKTKFMDTDEDGQQGSVKKEFKKEKKERKAEFRDAEQENIRKESKKKKGNETKNQDEAETNEETTQFRDTDEDVQRGNVRRESKKEKKKRKANKNVEEGKAAEVLTGDVVDEGIVEQKMKRRRSFMKKHRRKKNTERVQFISETSGTQNGDPVEGDQEQQASEAEDQDGGCVTCVTVHRCDLLEGYPTLLPHPVVQVHICDVTTGDYVSLRRGGETVSSGSLTTKPLHRVALHRKLSCVWEEQLIFNIDINYITESRKRDVVVFFQIMEDTSSLSKKHLTRSDTNKTEKDGLESQQQNQKLDIRIQIDSPENSKKNEEPLKQDGSFNKLISGTTSNDLRWKTFAWAFLKVCGANNHLNIGERLRLQLFYPKKSCKVRLIELYSWWKSGSRSKYPSTLYISLFGASNTNEESTEGIGNETYPISDKDSSAPKTENNVEQDHTDEPDEEVKWARKPYASCNIPNSISHEFDVPAPGCLCLKYSHKGTKIACAVYKTIQVYEAVKGKLLHKFIGHLGLIYDISWHKEDQKLITASADCTARIWHMQPSKRSISLTLVHPSYVYVVRWIPNSEDLVCTGCFDQVIRVWKLLSNEYTCIQETTEHFGFVNAMCFNHEGNLLYSGDQKGVIHVWKVNPSNISSLHVENDGVLVPEHEARMGGIIGNTINCLAYHCGGHRLLVHTRDSQLHLVNHKAWKNTHILQGPLNLTEQVRGCLSPCGRWVFAGGEDASLLVWNSDTGELASGMLNLPFSGTISCVDYHPHDHMLAISSYDATSNTKIVLMTYKGDVNELAPTNIPVSVQPVASPSSLTLKEKSAANRWKESGNSLLTKLDVVLKMAAEDPLNIYKLHSQEKVQPPKSVAIVLHNFRSSDDNELSVKTGDYVTVVDDSNPEWWMVRTSDELAEGFVPVSYLERTLRTSGPAFGDAYPKEMPPGPSFGNYQTKDSASRYSLGNDEHKKGTSRFSFPNANEIESFGFDNLNERMSSGFSTYGPTRNVSGVNSKNFKQRRASEFLLRNRNDGRTSNPSKPGRRKSEYILSYSNTSNNGTINHNLNVDNNSISTTKRSGSHKRNKYKVKGRSQHLDSRSNSSVERSPDKSLERDASEDNAVAREDLLEEDHGQNISDTVHSSARTRRHQMLEENDN
uniref:Jouberin isoform X2 n=1 Tax=Hirondellea gigas TaxID=1518452 RepID=A0A6A7FVG6_9CRUS